MLEKREDPDGFGVVVDGSVVNGSSILADVMSALSKKFRQGWWTSSPPS